MNLKPVGAANAYQSVEPRIRPLLLSLVRAAAPAYLKLALGIRKVKLEGDEHLAEAYSRFQEGSLRFLIAFRHPGDADPQLMYLMSSKLAWEASAKTGRKPIKKTHAHFLHGYEVPLWSGPLVRWLLPRVGALPVYHKKLDLKTMEKIRHLIKDGEYPVSLAPEGQITYHSGRVTHLEQGVSQMCFWCAADLKKEGRGEETAILPVSIRYTWEEKHWRALSNLLSRTEKLAGLAAEGQKDPRRPYRRIMRLAEHLLAETETYYARFHGYVPQKEEGPLSPRLAKLIDHVLSVAEKQLCISAQGDSLSRVYAIRQEAWDRIFRADLPPIERLPSLQRDLAHRAAAEAHFAARHMELADLAMYLDETYISEDSPLDLFMEAAQNLYDVVNRLRGGNVSSRAAVAGKTAVITVGKLIPADPLYPKYIENRKEAVKTLTEQLREAYLGMMEVKEQ